MNQLLIIRRGKNRYSQFLLPERLQIFKLMPFVVLDQKGKSVIDIGKGIILYQ